MPSLKNSPTIDVDAIAKMLRTNKSALASFDEAYENAWLKEENQSMFDFSAKDAVEEGLESFSGHPPLDQKLIERIVDELLAKTSRWSYDGASSKTDACILALPFGEPLVKADEIYALPKPCRPQLTGNLMTRDLDGPPSYMAVLDFYRMYLESRDSSDSEAKKHSRYCYWMFRRGLDILDLDDIIVQVLGTNPNSMGNWLPQMVAPVEKGGFFRIPKTTIIKVPTTLLQLSRLEYSSLTPATKAILDEFCFRAFRLDESKDYFIKTGTFSSKFDFRNAHVSGAKEVRELGEYLLFIQYQAVRMASYDLSGVGQPCIIGASTTNEWVVREFIRDSDDRPTIYHGLPLHTEYRAFVDFDTKEVLGIHPYWDADVMKNRFDNGNDADTANMKHDAVTFRVCEPDLQKQYEENKGMVVRHLEDVLRNNVPLSGQWSVDIMQNGDDFWLIDMAVASMSSFYNVAVPKKLRKPFREDWIPRKPVPELNHL